TPVFRRGRIVALFACTSHLMDIGGIGFGPDASDVYMEGLFLPMLKLAERGKMNETLLAIIRANTRQPVDTIGDVYSLAACNDVGAKRLIEMMDEFDLDDLTGLTDFICASSERAVRAEIARLPKGTWTNRMTTDGYDKPIELVAALTVSDQGIHVDYTGTSSPSAKGINVPIAYTTAYTVFGLGCIVASKIPNNAGSLKPLTVSAPADSILNAQPPAPVLLRHVIGQMLPDVVFGCLRQAIPDRVPAEGAACLWNIIMRGPAPGSNSRYAFNVVFTSNGGTGARPDKDGLSATAYPSGVKGTPVEIAESIMPLIFWKKELKPDSAGAGETRGGLGQEIEIESAANLPFEVLAAFDRVEHPPRGRDGGKNGAAGRIALASGQPMRAKGAQTIEPGQRLVLHTPGGAGMGKAEARARQRVKRDLQDGLITGAKAGQDYGAAGEAAE
ncbi:MAG: hydantoinase B/oxoprolinase family protein, partial [Alphaproteobacteria bacterium]|nr:hydantoinase B/oxoprolinase family protein [Alphaproteobacteria bacterium]